MITSEGRCGSCERTVGACECERDACGTVYPPAFYASLAQPKVYVITEEDLEDPLYAEYIEELKAHYVATLDHCTCEDKAACDCIPF